MKKYLTIAMLAMLVAVSVFADDTTTNMYSGSTTTYPLFVAPTEVDVTVTNGQTIYLIAERMNLTSVGSTSGYTNTLTIGQPYRLGGRVTLRVDAASSNKVKIATAAHIPMSWSWIAGDDESMTVDVIATNKAVRIWDGSTSMATASVAVVQGVLDSSPTAAGAFTAVGAVTGASFAATGTYTTNSYVTSVVLVSATQANYVVRGEIYRGNVYSGVTGLTTNSSTY